MAVLSLLEEYVPVLVHHLGLAMAYFILEGQKLTTLVKTNSFEAIITWDVLSYSFLMHTAVYKVPALLLKKP